MPHSCWILSVSEPFRWFSPSQRGSITTKSGRVRPWSSSHMTRQSALRHSSPWWLCVLSLGILRPFWNPESNSIRGLSLDSRRPPASASLQRYQCFWREPPWSSRLMPGSARNPSTSNLSSGKEQRYQGGLLPQRPSRLIEHGTCARRLSRSSRKSDDKEQGSNIHRRSRGGHALALSPKEWCS